MALLGSGVSNSIWCGVVSLCWG